MPVTLLSCPTGCASLANLPIISTDFCTPVNKSSELTTLFFALPAAADFTDATQLAEWTDRLSQDGTIPSGSTATIDDLIRTAYIVGDMPAPTATEVEISGGRKKQVNPLRTVNLEIDDATDSMYQFARRTECGNFTVKAWLKTLGNVGFGGNTGITGSLLLHPVLARGRDSIEKYVGTFTWNAQTAPDRIDPMPV